MSALGVGLCISTAVRLSNKLLFDLTGDSVQPLL